MFDKNIPIPSKNNYNIDKMEVGDSLLISDSITSSKLGNIINTVTYKFGYRYTQRKVDGGRRVWRIA